MTSPTFKNIFRTISRKFRNLKIKTLLNLLKASLRRQGLDKFEILLVVAKDIYPGYKFHWPQLDWFKQKNFWEFIGQYDEKRGLNAHRKWSLAQLFRLCAHLPGDIAECGVYTGASSLLLCESIKRLNLQEKKCHLFDSFEGISEPGLEDGNHWTRGDLSCAENYVLETFAEYKSIVYTYKGWIPDRFMEVAENKFCFVHIDVDLYQPTIDCLRFFYPRMIDGGIILCDDYGSSLCPGATKACEEYMLDKTESVIALASGGGFLMKNNITADPGPTLELS